MGELTPYLCVVDARRAIEWYVEVLGAEVVLDPIVMDDGRIGHVELAVGGGRWMMSTEFESAGVAAPDTSRGAAVAVCACPIMIAIAITTTKHLVLANRRISPP